MASCPSKTKTAFGVYSIHININTLKLVTLPEHLIFDNILLRLPVKTLIRFKSVSKDWFSTISSPEFAKSQLTLSQSQSCSSQFIVSTLPYAPHEFKSLLSSHDDNLNVVENPIDIAFLELKRYRSAREVGSCDGLVCLFTRQVRSSSSVSEDDPAYLHFQFIICNPSTHQCLRIAIPNTLGSSGTPTFWFDYVPSVDDYKVVTLVPVDSKITYCYAYSLKVGKWTRYHGVDDLNWFYDRLSQNTRVFNDVLYVSPEIAGDWNIPTRYLHEFRPNTRIIGYDLVTEQGKVFPWMDWLNAYTSAEFFVLNGCLSLFCRSRGHDMSALFSQCDVWMLKQHDDWSSWERTVQVEIAELLVVTPTGKFLVCQPYGPYGRTEDRRQRWYRFRIIDITKNVEGQFQENKNAYISSAYVSGASVYVESLVSPFRST